MIPRKLADGGKGYECLTAREAEDILDELKIKSKYVPWNSGERKEHFGIIARKIRGKAGLRRKGYLVFDQGDF